MFDSSKGISTHLYLALRVCLAEGWASLSMSIILSQHQHAQDRQRWVKHFSYCTDCVLTRRTLLPLLLYMLAAARAGRSFQYRLDWCVCAVASMVGWVYVCVCVCMYMYVYVYICICMYICMYVYVYICICICEIKIPWFEIGGSPCCVILGWEKKSPDWRSGAVLAVWTWAERKNPLIGDRGQSLLCELGLREKIPWLEIGGSPWCVNLGWENKSPDWRSGAVLAVWSWAERKNPLIGDQGQSLLCELGLRKKKIPWLEIGGSPCCVILGWEKKSPDWWLGAVLAVWTWAEKKKKKKKSPD